MWMIFAILSMILCAAGEVLGKKVVREHSAVIPLMAYATSSLFCFISAIVMWLGGLGESGASPVQLLTENPLIILAAASTFLAAILTLVAFRYIGVSVEAVISGVSAVFLFLGLVSINVFTGKLESVKELLAPGRLIPVIFIIAFIFCLARTDGKSENALPKPERKHTDMLIGILIMLLSCVFDASDSLIVSYCVADDQIGAMDYYIAADFIDILFGAGCFAAAVLKAKKTRVSFRECAKAIPVMVVMGILGVGAMYTYLAGSGYDAVKLAMLFIAYPIVPLIGARVFLKEKYTVRQYLCIFGIAAASIVFCLMDYVS